MSIRPLLMRPGGPVLVQISTSIPWLMGTPFGADTTPEMNIGRSCIDELARSGMVPGVSTGSR